jgi:isochorismate pyruvate lyase
MVSFKKAEECKSKEEIRQQIDLVDAELIKLFAERTEYVREITKFKHNTTKEIIAEERKQLVIEQRSEWAEKLGLNKEFYAKLFKMLLEHNISLEFEIFENEKK